MNPAAPVTRYLNMSLSSVGSPGDPLKPSGVQVTSEVCSRALLPWKSRHVLQTPPDRP